jgi:hypothetical protein
MTDVVIQVTDNTQLRVGIFKEKHVSISKWYHHAESGEYKPKSGQTFPKDKAEEVVKAIQQVLGMSATDETPVADAKPKAEKKQEKAAPTEVENVQGETVRYLVIAERPSKAADLAEMLGEEDFDFASEKAAKKSDGWANNTLLCKTKVEKGVPAKFKIIAKFNRSKNAWVEA